MGHQTVQWIDTSLIFGHKMIQFAITQIGNIINNNYGLLWIFSFYWFHISALIQ